MKRITVDVSEDTMSYLEAVKKIKGSSITFEANALIEQAIKERNRKKKLPLSDASKENNPV